MILLGGGGDAVEHAEHAAEAAESAFAKLAAWLDHCWHELENGDLMTWAAFVAMLTLVALIIVGVGVYRGSITFRRG